MDHNNYTVKPKKGDYMWNQDYEEMPEDRREEEEAGLLGESNTDDDQGYWQDR